MGNDKRILTVVVELQGDEGNWLWEAHMKGPKNGVKVLALGDGNAYDEIEKLENECVELQDQRDLDV